MAGKEQVFIALGSNIEPEYHLRQAVNRLALRCHILAVAPVYETAPVGKLDQLNFLNTAVLVETDLTAAELKMQVLQEIEKELGRVRTADKNAPRTIDMDITLFGDRVLDLEHRHIPDPDLLRYAHIALPMADLAPDYRHPESGQTMCEIASQLPDAGIVLRLDIKL